MLVLLRKVTMTMRERSKVGKVGMKVNTIRLSNFIAFMIRRRHWTRLNKKQLQTNMKKKMKMRMLMMK